MAPFTVATQPLVAQELLVLLSDLVQSEYAQWMRYTYLSALGWGLHTDSLHQHFSEHAGQELEHAQELSRWLVDLGGLPPTCIPPVEQFQGSAAEAIAWLLEAEVEGINKYTMLRASAEGLPGLQAQIDENLLSEHEHLSDLMRLCEVPEEDDQTIIIIASKNPAHAMRCVADRKSAVSMANAMNWIKSILTQYRGSQFHTMEDGQQVILEAIEDEITRMWPKRQTPHVLRDLQNYKQLYEMVSDKSSWPTLYNHLFPQQAPEPTPQEMLQGIQMPEDPNEVLDVDRPQPIEISPVGKQPGQSNVDHTKLQQEINEYVPPTGPGQSINAPAPATPRRPADAVMQHGVFMPGKKQQFPAQVGDRVRDMQSGAMGLIKKLNPDGSMLVDTDAGKLERWAGGARIEFDAKSDSPEKAKNRYLKQQETSRG